MSALAKIIAYIIGATNNDKASPVSKARLTFVTSRPCSQSERALCREWHNRRI